MRITVVVNVELQGDADLFEIGAALNRVGPLFRVGQRRQQHRRQDGDDRNHHQQFNQRETERSSSFTPDTFLQ